MTNKVTLNALSRKHAQLQSEAIAAQSKLDRIQTQISDWSNGKGKRFTEKSKRVINFIEDYRNSPNQRIPENIESAVRALLNEDKLRADAIEKILNSLGDALA